MHLPINIADLLQGTVKAYVKAQVEAYDQAQVNLSETELKILNICQKNAASNKEIIANLGHKTLSGHLKKSLKHLQEVGAIVYAIQKNPEIGISSIKLPKKENIF